MPAPARLLVLLHGWLPVLLVLQQGPRSVLTVVPYGPDNGGLLPAVARRVEAIQPHHALLSVLTGFYLVGAFTLTFAPDTQLFTQGSRPVFDLMSPNAWALWFLIASMTTAAVLTRLTGPRQVLAWLVVLPSQTVWIGAGLIAVLMLGKGSALGVLFPVTVFAFTLVTAWVTWRAYTSGKR